MCGLSRTCCEMLLKTTTVVYLKGDLVKVEAVTHVVVCTDGLGVVVHHDGFVAHLEDDTASSAQSAQFVRHPTPPDRNAIIQPVGFNQNQSEPVKSDLLEGRKEGKEGKSHVFDRCHSLLPSSAP